MIGCGNAKVQKNRLAALAALTELGEATVVLKGASSLVASGSDIHLCSAGNPGMAVAGMGDVLSGIIGALLAQRLAPVEAARLGVFIHATAGDQAAAQGQIGLLPTDLIGELRGVINGLEQTEKIEN